jgi:hypothetical protein
MIAPILGRNARIPVSRPSRAAIGTPPIISSSQVPTPSTAMPSSRPAISRPQRPAHPVGGAVEAVAVLARQHPGDAALVEPRLDRDEQADHQDHDQVGEAAEHAADRRRQHAQ